MLGQHPFSITLGAVLLLLSCALLIYAVPRILRSFRGGGAGKRKINPATNPSPQTIEQVLMNIIAEQFGIDYHELSPQTPLSSFGGDSLDEVELVMQAEDVFEIRIEDSYAEPIAKGTIAYFASICLTCGASWPVG